MTRTAPPVELRPGDVVLFPHGSTHALSHAPAPFSEIAHFPVPDGPFVPLPVPPPRDGADLLCGAYRLEGGRHHAALDLLPEVIHVTGDRPGLRSVIDLLTVDATEPQTGSDLSRPALIDLFLIHVLRIWESERPTAGWATVGDPVVASALKELHANPERPWSVQLLGTAAGLSRTAFTRRFTATVGQPPMAYLTAWRLNNGAQLLRETDASLATIARRVGYSSEFAFSTAFRRQFGTAPGHFRRATGN